MVQLQRSIMYTGLLSVVRYCGGVVNSGVHTLTVGHLCVCVFVNKYGLQRDYYLGSDYCVCVCVCVCVQFACMCVCMGGMELVGEEDGSMKSCTMHS